MTDTTTSASGGDLPMRAIVESYGPAARGAEGIPEEHQQYADQVLQMDPFDDVPSAVKDTAGRRPMNLKASGLPDDMRLEVQAKLHALPRELRDGAESQLVAEAIRGKRVEIRVKTGLGEDALPFHREQITIARQVRDLVQRRGWFESELSRVRSYGTQTDPETGEVSPVEEKAINGPRRDGYQNQIDDIDRQIRLLMNPDGTPGIEAKRRVREALAESAAMLHQIAQQKAEAAEVKRRAVEINRENRINARAQSLARMQRNEIK